MHVIRCLPKGVCSWNFLLDGNGETADLKIDWGKEQGTITIDGTVLNVLKHGVFSGRWTLEVDDMVIASAQKKDALRSSFQLEDATGVMTLKAISAFGRSYQLFAGSNVVATIQPDHAFTRRASITIHTKALHTKALHTEASHAGDLAFNTVVFAFWLTILMWKRHASNM